MPGSLRWMLLLLPFAALAQSQSTSPQTVRGVSPADNVTKLELLPKLQVANSDPGSSLFVNVFKLDKAVRGTYGFSFEIPVAFLKAGPLRQTGTGDLIFKGRYQKDLGRATIVSGFEAIAPIATSQSLGTGKFQLNPVVAAVYPFSAKFFVAASAKQIFSVAGKQRFENIRQAQYRLLAAYISPKGAWLLLDPQLWVDYRRNSRLQFAPEVEHGRMISPKTAIFGRAGGHVAGCWHRYDWTVSGGIRWLLM